MAAPEPKQSAGVILRSTLKSEAPVAPAEPSAAPSSSRHRHTPVSFKNLATIAAVAILYFAAGKLGLYYASFSASSSAIWPPSGIAFAALLLLGSQLWPAVFV